jgi:O-antigen ligase
MANFQPMSIRRPIAVIIMMWMAMALVWSKALLSILPVLLLVPALIDIRVNPFRLVWQFSLDELKTSIRQRPYIWSFTLFFLLYFVSILYAGNISEWWKLTHIKSPFLLLPFCFAALPPLSRREYMLIVLCMILTALWSTIWVQVAYYSNYYIFSQSLGFGGSLPTPINHIRYSVIIALSMLICASFFFEKWKLRYKWERWAYGLSAVYLFYFLHVLSVRSGLALGYAGILIMLAFYVRKLRLWKQISLACIIIAAPFIAYKAMPGFALKVNYTLYDLGKFKAGEGEDYSDSERWESWRAGLTIGNQHPFFGTGTGKFRSVLEDHYNTVLKKDTWTRPHNQWINVFAVLGLFGVTVFIFTLIYPMTFRLFWSPPLMPVLYIVQVLSMVVEHPLDTTFGTMLFLLLSLVGISYQESQHIRRDDNSDS